MKRTTAKLLPFTYINMIKKTRMMTGKSFSCRYICLPSCKGEGLLH